MVGTPPHQGRGGQQPQATVIRRRRKGIQQALQHKGSVAVQHVSLGHQSCGHTSLRQGPPQIGRLVVPAHQDAELIGAQCRLFDQQLHHHLSNSWRYRRFDGGLPRRKVLLELQQLQGLLSLGKNRR